MHKLITENRIERLINEYNIKLPNDPSETDITNYIKKLIFISINSIDEKELSNIVAKQFEKASKFPGIIR